MARGRLSCQAVCQALDTRTTLCQAIGMTKTADAKVPLAIGVVRSYSPVDGIVVRMQRVRAEVHVVTVERVGFGVDELRRSYPTRSLASAYARLICLDLRAGWTLDEIASELLLATVTA